MDWLFSTPSLIQVRALLQNNAAEEEDGGWVPWEDMRFSDNGQPLVWERSYGRGKFVLVNGILGASLVHSSLAEGADRIANYIISQLSKPISNEVKPVRSAQSIIILPVDTPKGRLSVIIGDSLVDRGGYKIGLKASQGTYHDYWNGQTYAIPSSGELQIESNDGIAVLRRLEE